MVKPTVKSRYRVKVFVATILITLLILVGCAVGGDAESPAASAPPGAGASQEEQVAIDLPHIHGLGFSADGRQLIVPAHDGLRLFAGGRWQVPDVPAHDYMGFAPADDGFYSSGHPHPSAGLANPLGLVKSTDGGQTLVRMGFEGESDFHLMAVGYENHAIYVANPAPNSRLPAGLHYSLDDGQTWQQSALQGVNGQIGQIAVHPTNANVVALATEGGLFLSEDYGDSFGPVTGRGPATAVTFYPDGQQLLAGYTLLLVYDLATRHIGELPTPTLAAGDAVSYMAVNPARPAEIALATFSRDIYLSPDGGQSWQPIAQDGRTVDLPTTE